MTLCVFKEKRWNSYLVYSQKKRKRWEEERKRRQAGEQEEEKVPNLLSGPLDPRYWIVAYKNLPCYWRWCKLYLRKLDSMDTALLRRVLRETPGDYCHFNNYQHHYIIMSGWSKVTTVDINRSRFKAKISQNCAPGILCFLGCAGQEQIKKSGNSRMSIIFLAKITMLRIVLLRLFLTWKFLPGIFLSWHVARRGQLAVPVVNLQQ